MGAVLALHATHAKRNKPGAISRNTTNWREFHALFYSHSSPKMMEAMAPTAEAAGGPPPEPGECPAAPPSRKRPRTAADDGGGATGRRVLIYTTCYNVIDGCVLLQCGNKS